MSPNKLPRQKHWTGEHKMATRSSHQTTPGQERVKSKAKVRGRSEIWSNVTSHETETMIEERDKATAVAAVAGTQI